MECCTRFNKWGNIETNYIDTVQFVHDILAQSNQWTQFQMNSTAVRSQIATIVPFRVEQIDIAMGYRLCQI